MLLHLVLWTFFRLKLLSIGCGSIETGCVLVVLMVAVAGVLDFDLVWSITFFVLSFVVKFVLVGLIGVLRLVVSRGKVERFVVGPISRFEQLRVIVILVESVSRFLSFFYGYAVGFIEMLVGSLSLEGDVTRRTVMLAYMKEEVPHEQI